MTTDSVLDEKIRAYVLELVATSPPAPELQLDHRDLNSLSRPKSPRRTVVYVALASAAAVIAIAALVVVPQSASKQVSEGQLGMRLTAYAPITQPIPAGYLPVATGTFFGTPWVVSGVNPSGGRICVALSYRGSVLFGGCSLTGHRIPNPPSWARSAFFSSLGTTADGQRYLVAVTNSTVSKLTVRTKDGTFVTTTVLKKRLGNASYFVLSLGRQGNCHVLCQGEVTLSLSTPSGPTLIDDRPSLSIHDYEGAGAALNAPIG